MARNPDLTAYLTRNAGEDEVLARVSEETSRMANSGMKSRPDVGRAADASSPGW